MTHTCCASCGPVSDGRPRAFVLTGLAHGLLDADRRVIPADLFTTEQFDAIRNAGYDIFFIPADSLLGVAS